MRLYRTKIPHIAHEVIERLTAAGMIEVSPETRGEAELDLIAIMEEYHRRDIELRNTVREYMSDHGVPYEHYGRLRSQMADQWGHPIGDDVERYLARQFIENFMLSNFVDEVYADDKTLYGAILDVLKANDVDERALREEAKEQIRNIPEGTVDYEVALSKALKEVKKRHGLLS